jgi:hypothetical protein
MRNLLLAAAGLAASALFTPLTAAPLVRADAGIEAGAAVTTVAWRYHRQCVWVNNGWHYQSGGKHLVCRPYKPSGAGWTWYSEGGHEGWYHKGRKEWHHKW